MSGVFSSSSVIEEETRRLYAVAEDISARWRDPNIEQRSQIAAAWKAAEDALRGDLRLKAVLEFTEAQPPRVPGDYGIWRDEAEYAREAEGAIIRAARERNRLA